jgi:replicative DNA helicase Mcm
VIRRYKIRYPRYKNRKAREIVIIMILQSHTPPSGKKIPVSSWRVVIILSSVATMVLYAETMLVPAIPDLIKDFNITYSTSSWTTHRYDSEFHYYAIGRTDKLLTSEKFYEILLELFEGCFLMEEQGRQHNKDQNQKRAEPNNHKINFHSLSPEIIQVTVDYLSPYAIKNHRNDLALGFGGTAFHSRISEESAARILEGICDRAGDEEKRNRLQTLHSTYEKGVEGERVIGGPTLAELIMQVKNYNILTAKKIVDTLKGFWREDIRKQESENETLVELSITKAKREQKGLVKVRGKIIGISPVYNMIKSIDLQCTICDYHEHVTYPKPTFKSHIKERSKCPNTTDDMHSSGSTVVADYEYLSTVDIELQDLDKFSDIDRLQVKLFEGNTCDVVAGEIIEVTGHLYVIRRNDNLQNKLETVLFVDTMQYANRQELTLTNEDIREIQEWKNRLEKENKEPIDELVSIFAPEIIELEHVKKGLLITCANAGIKNIDSAFPKRQRINGLLIGDPGLTKTTLLEKILELVPNSQYAGGQSSTGLSLTAQISKEDGGSYNLRYGPVVLAKGSICGINELGQLPLSEHKHLLDCMEGNGFPIAKYGFPTFIETYTSIIASANPINNKWKSSSNIDNSEFPTLTQIIDRFDLIFIFRENRDPRFLRLYGEKRREIAEKYERKMYEGNKEFLQRYIAHARTFCPKISDEAFVILEEFFIEMGKAGVTGIFRKLESLLRVAIGIARLKLKWTVDLEDAKETIEIFRVMFQNYNHMISAVRDPRDVSYEEIKQVVREHNGYPIHFTEAVRKACEHKELVKYYLMGKEDISEDKLRLNTNWKLRPIVDLLRKDQAVEFVSEMPIVLRWNQQALNERRQIHEDTGKMQLKSEVCDVCDVNLNNRELIRKDKVIDLIETNNVNDNKSSEEEDQEENVQNISLPNARPGSHTSHTSHDVSTLSEKPNAIDTIENQDSKEKPEKQIQLRHSSHAVIITNNDLDEIKEDEELISSAKAEEGDNM